jgi:DNA-binding MarR family transcriptional regulator
LQILTLVAEEQNITEADLRKIFGITSTTMSVIIKRLETKGLLEKNRGHKVTNDGREKPIILTEQGKVTQRGLLDYFALDAVEIAGALDVHDLNALQVMLEKFNKGTKRSMDRVFGRQYDLYPDNNPMSEDSGNDTVDHPNPAREALLNMSIPEFFTPQRFEAAGVSPKFYQTNIHKLHRWIPNIRELVKKGRGEVRGRKTMGGKTLQVIQQLLAAEGLAF